MKLLLFHKALFFLSFGLGIWQRHFLNRSHWRDQDYTVGKMVRVGHFCFLAMSWVLTKDLCSEREPTNVENSLLVF